MVVKQGIAILVACCLNATFAGAQTIVVKVLERPDPTTVTVPDMAFKPGRSDLRGFDDYFYFHKSGVSYERAFTDMDQCRIQSEMAHLAKCYRLTSLVYGQHCINIGGLIPTVISWLRGRDAHGAGPED